MRRIAKAWDQQNPPNTTIHFNEADHPDFTPFNIKAYDTFISHKGSDLALAEQIGDLLHRCGIKGYLDRWDPAVTGDSPDLEEYLRRLIRDTPTILAVITESTNTSWWVPFEIGVARETDSQIATFIQVDESRRIARELPSYLKSWPIMASLPEVIQWATNLNIVSPLQPGARQRVIMKDASTLSEAARPNREIDRLVRQGKVRFTT